MKTYIGTKNIRAKPMTRLEYNALRGWTVPDDENPADAGYLVEYIDGGKANVEGFDGYVSWSPADVFNRAYRPVNCMTFGAAVEAMKAGLKVARKGWNGHGMFAYYVPAGHYRAQTDVAKSVFGHSSLVPYREYFALKTAQGDVATWAPSCSDALADDWMIV